MRVAVLQVSSGDGNAGANTERFVTMIERVCDEHRPDLVVLPELAVTGLAIDRAARVAETRQGQVIRRFGEVARRLKTSIIPGTIWEQDGDRLFNSLAVIGPDGELCGWYRKVHLFKPMGEHLAGTGGDRVCLNELDGFGPIGLAICYDLRFPELFRVLAHAGAIAFVVPAAWPVERIDHWQALSRARAIENQAFVIGVNRCGSDGDYSMGGKSLVVGPDGMILAEAGPDEQTLVCDLDRELVDRMRNRIPVLDDVVPGAYRLA